jgi:hypothetical protein
MVGERCPKVHWGVWIIDSLDKSHEAQTISRGNGSLAVLQPRRNTKARTGEENHEMLLLRGKQW